MFGIHAHDLIVSHIGLLVLLIAEKGTVAHVSLLGCTRRCVVLPLGDHGVIWPRKIQRFAPLQLGGFVDNVSNGSDGSIEEVTYGQPLGGGSWWEAYEEERLRLH